MSTFHVISGHNRIVIYQVEKYHGLTIGSIGFHGNSKLHSKYNVVFKMMK